MDFIKKTALSLGFDACGVARATALTEDAEFLSSWLAAGKHADLHYLKRNFEKRTDPRILVPGCKSVVVVLMNYFPAEAQNAEAPQIAKYAYPETDYHAVLKSKLTDLEKKLVETYGPGCVSDTHQHLFVDSAPVLERRWAERAGLGWIGKHTQLIAPGFGSFVFIGILMLNIDLAEYDSPVADRCGNCTRCMDACPTSALGNRTLDARLCLSYQTIENRGEIPVELRGKLSNCALGCDICADVCPWNKKWSKPHNHAVLTPVENMLHWNAGDWKKIPKEQFDTLFKNSAVKRAGFFKLKDNIRLISTNNEE
ncbi:MAG TPA: tRNA epoxyqueuosine(34) reductase QueG [Paludibacter sp.]|nr:tRNA epoxyqueuosine(34) reductase QueG [Paludibacter sp.]